MLNGKVCRRDVGSNRLGRYCPINMNMVITVVPKQMLVVVSWVDRSFCFEMAATSEWEDRLSNSVT